MLAILVLWACTGTDESAGDGLAGGLSIEADSAVVTMLRAVWTAADEEDVAVEYRFEGGDWLVAPAVAPGEAVLLGLPAETEVEARLVRDVGGEARRGGIVTTATGPLPDGLLLPEIDGWAPALADPAPWVMISVAGGDFTYEGPWWLEIVDRRGQVIWYAAVGEGAVVLYPDVALDGTHVWYDAGNLTGLAQDEPHAMRRTLDGRWSTRVELPDMRQAVGEGPDGSFLHEHVTAADLSLWRADPDGVSSLAWDCGAWMEGLGRSAGDCAMNAVHWSETRGTVLVSMWPVFTIVEVDLATGTVLRQMGQLAEGEPWTFEPPESVFELQHGPSWTPEGTLLVSTRTADEWRYQVAAEYALDDASQTLTRVWSYTSTRLWATQCGEAVRLPNGNTVLGYGQDGVVREVTPEGEIAWQVSWPKDQEGYRVVGHVSFIDDLYALNRGEDP